MYLLDTNTFLTPKNSYYSFEICPGFWTWLLDQHSKKNVFSSMHVKRELTAKSDDLATWIEKKVPDPFFIKPSEETGANMTLIADYIMKLPKDRYRPEARADFLAKADSYIIAQAKELRATVVTFEQSDNGTSRIKIPDICEHFGIPCENLFALMKKFPPQFSLTRTR